MNAINATNLQTVIMAKACVIDTLFKILTLYHNFFKKKYIYIIVFKNWRKSQQSRLVMSEKGVGVVVHDSLSS